MAVKICFISNYAYRLFNRRSRIVFGGSETIFYILAKDLASDKKFAVSFLLEDDVHKKTVTEETGGIKLFKTSRQVQPGTHQDEAVEKYRHWFTYWAKKFNLLWQLPHLDFFRLWENLKQINADVYIFASSGYESGLITWVTKILKKKSIFITANDELFNLKDRIFLFALKHADIVWCFSKRHQKLLADKYKIKAVYLPPYYPRPKNFLPFKKRKYLLWVGRVEARKRPEMLVKLAKRLPGLPFTMITTASTRGAVKLPNLKIIQNVMFDRLEPYYRSALAFIDTSDYKNLNMTQVQAAYCKTPCLTLYNDPNDSFKEYGWGISADGNWGRMIKNVRMVLTRPRLWQRLSGNAYSFADKIYNSEKNLRIFKQLIFKLTK